MVIFGKSHNLPGQQRLLSANSSIFRILNMFDMDSRPTIVKSVVESADSRIESTDSTIDFAQTPLKIGLWVRALTLWYSTDLCCKTV